MGTASIMNLLDRNKRREERVVTEVPVDLGGTKGITRNVSASGIFLEIDAGYALGSSMAFEVELNTPGGKMRLKGKGSIVRVEPRDKKAGVAMKITESTLEARDENECKQAAVSADFGSS
jgi:Tfp pilus assembly protein PilZ